MFEIIVLLEITLIITALVLRRRIRGIHHGILRFFLLSLVIGFLVFVASWQFSKLRTYQLFGELIPRVETTRPLVALTFDDGPTPEYTDAVLSMLREKQVKATFFVIGQELERNPEEGQKLVADGHQLGNHTYSHQTMVFQPFSFIQDEIERTDKLIRKAGYQGEILFRTPYGKKLILLPYYLANTGRKHIYYDVEPESFPEIAASADKIVAYVLEKTRPGSIILLHVMYASGTESRKALPRILRGLQDKGYQFVTVSELLTAG